MAGEDEKQRGERERVDTSTEQAQRRRSEPRADPVSVVVAPEPDVASELGRFDRLKGLDLDQEERRMLIYGLSDWGGPAYGSDALAVAMGFADMDALCDEAVTLCDAIHQKRALSIRDWTRALVATEVAFASTVLGTGPDEWYAINGGTAEEMISVLERLQAKLPRGSAALGDL